MQLNAMHFFVIGHVVTLQLQLQYFIVSSQYIYETLTISNILIIQILIRNRERERKRKKERERNKERKKKRKEKKREKYIN